MSVFNKIMSIFNENNSSCDKTINEIKYQKYVFLNKYKVKLNDDITLVCNFYKYTGLYMLVCKTSFSETWHYFDNKEIYEEAIKVLETRYINEKIEILHNEKYDIGLSENECLFTCPYCDEYIYERGEYWNNGGEENCEEKGIKLKLEIRLEYSMKTINTFIKFIENYICDVLEMGGLVCDTDNENSKCEGYSFTHDNIYFCRKCEDDKSIHNLCKLCYNEENVKKHQIDYPDHDDFYLKPKMYNYLKDF